MTLPDLLPWLGLPGGTAIIVVIYNYHRDAVKAHKERADDWKSAYLKESARADELQKQVFHILDAVKATTTTG